MLYFYTISLLVSKSKLVYRILISVDVCSSLAFYIAGYLCCIIQFCPAWQLVSCMIDCDCCVCRQLINVDYYQTPNICEMIASQATTKSYYSKKSKTYFLNSDTCIHYNIRRPYVKRN